MLCLVKLESLWLVSNKKDYLKWKSKPSHMSQKVLDSGLVIIRKSKVALTFNKPVYVGMCILDLSKVLMYKFDCDYIKNKYGNNGRLLFTETDSLKLKPKIYSKILARIKKCLILAITHLSQKIMMIQTD